MMSTASLVPEETIKPDVKLSLAPPCPELFKVIVDSYTGLGFVTRFFALAVYR